LFYQYRNQIVPVGAYGTPFDDPGTTLVDTRMMAELRVEPRLSKMVELLLRAHANRSVSHEAFAAPSGQPPSVEDYLGTWFGGEARVVVTPVDWLRLTGGGEYQAHPQATMTGVTLSPDGTPTPYLNEKHPYQFGAGYLMGEVSPRAWVRAMAGARIDGYSTFGPIVVPRAALIFKPGQGNVIKIMGGRAFRAPSVYEQFYNAPNYELPGNDPAHGFKLAPESIWSGEVEYSRRFLEDWVALVAGYGGFVENLIDTITVIDTTTNPPTMLKRYANSTSPALLAGGDVEIRREFRRGWMISASYGYERAQFLSSSRSDPRLLNAPEHMASFRGIAPVIRDVVIAALRLTLEAPRRIGFDAPATTGTALIADAAVSGNLRDYGIHYTVGVYNIADVRWAVPVSSTFLTPTLPQNGRTFLIDLMATYP
jgi:outer membrane receptor for ferrienterochelin and colicin